MDTALAKRQKPPMSSRINKIGLVDTGFWFALLNEPDTQHESALEKEERLSRLTYIVPWPTLYEALNSDFTKQPSWLSKFDVYLKRPNAELLDDAKYRDDALIAALEQSKRRGLSLVDNVLRMIIEDVNVRVDCIFTFDKRHFVDICKRCSVEII